MKKIIIFSIFFLSFNIYAENNILISKEKSIKESVMENKSIEFLNAIKIFNNSLALTMINGVTNIEIKDDGKFKPLFSKNKEQNIDAIDINYVNKQGESPLITAIEYKNNTILKELLKRNVSLEVKHSVLGKYPIHTAVYFNNFEAVKLLLEKNKEYVNFQNDIDGWTPLQDAVLKGNIEIINYLLDNGANPLLKDKEGKNALDLAINTAKGQIVKILRDNIKEKRRLKGE